MWNKSIGNARISTIRDEANQHFGIIVNKCTFEMSTIKRLLRSTVEHRLKRSGSVESDFNLPVLVFFSQTIFSVDVEALLVATRRACVKVCDTDSFSLFARYNENKKQTRDATCKQWNDNNSWKEEIKKPAWRGGKHTLMHMNRRSRILMNSWAKL